MRDEQKTKPLARPTKADEKALHYFNERMKAMQEKRSKRQPFRDQREKQCASPVGRDMDGDVIVNVPIDQVLVETYKGTQASLQYRVTKAEGEVNVTYLKLYELVFDHFMEREKTLDEISRYRSTKAIV